MTSEPSSLYRVQLHAGFRFEDAAAAAGYLAELGITHLYCSPYLQAMPGSMHGYDVVNYARINPELGGERGHAAMIAALRDLGLGHVLDIVPNHMAASPEHNWWWWDVLKHGRDSRYADYFDIDWGPPGGRLHDLIMLPVLADRYGVALGSGDLTLAEHDGEPAVAYLGSHFPVAPGSLAGTTVQDAGSDPVLLHEVLERQHYRLAYWRSDKEINYRRFFDVNELVAVRMARPQVFDDSHRLVLDLVRAGIVDGLRIDHIDGLRDPRAYLDRLHDRGVRAVWVEKVLASDETLPEDWPTHGTTGYEFASSVLELFVDPSAGKALTDLYEGFTTMSQSLQELEHDRKLVVLRDILSADLARLTQMFVGICDAEPGYRDFTRDEIRGALEALIAGLDVYRTYVQPERDEVSAEDVIRVERAAEVASSRGEADPVLLRFLVDVMLLRHRTDAADDFVLRLQQSSGPVMAKAVEDTTFYVFNRFAALNEVGADPRELGRSVGDFHRRNAWTQTYRPMTMLTTSTHDTKRGEDVRARLALLSEIPERWAEAVWHWAGMNEKHRSNGMPDRNTELLFYQTVVGAWPLQTERAAEYMRKASKEAKQHTSWVDPDPDYDEALETFVRGVLDDETFVAGLRDFVGPLIEPGRVNSLAQTLLKLTSPGIPDVYQGSELWNLSLVDPDNRRPVDYTARRELLSFVKEAPPGSVLERSDDGAPKILVVHRALELRARKQVAFGPHGSYVPLLASGDRSHRVVAFARSDEVVTVVPRMVMDLDWADTSLELPQGDWRDVFTGADHAGDAALPDLLGSFPVALLEKTR